MSSSSAIGLFDSNVPITPPGTVGMGAGFGSSTTWASVIAAFSITAGGGLTTAQLAGVWDQELSGGQMVGLGYV